ncbi:MAG: hypothetical protein U1C96_08665 [Gallionella sp.]|nr:hypothetical protein [Gallionella sp.]
MEINSATATTLSQLLNAPQAQGSSPSPAAVNTTSQTPQESTVVKLSAQALQLSRSEQTSSAPRAETQNNINTERAETRPQEIAEPPGIQFMESKSMRGRVDTYA